MIESMLTPALALTVQEAAAATGGESLGGAFVGLVLGLLQLVVSLAIFTFSINQGLSVVSKMIDGIDIWGEIKRKNMAVALLAAGAVVAYTNVVAGGVDSMTAGLTTLVKGDLSSGIGALIGGIANLVVAIAVAGLAISWTFKAMDKFTKDIDEKQEFRGGNVAIGIVYAGILVGASELIASGVSGVSSGITALINALI
jgi:uncharacterized membrane protein YjfL (UPF0719 family)